MFAPRVATLWSCMLMKATCQGYSHGVGDCRGLVTYPGVYVIESLGINVFAVEKLLVGIGKGIAPQPEAAHGLISQPRMVTAASW